MNNSALRNFATQARIELREKIDIKALQIGITEENIKKESVQSSDAVFIDGRQLSIKEQSQRNKLIDEINIKGYNQVIEEVAYTWFNRFIALRFMEVNNYLPTKVKVLSSEIEGSYEPDIIKEALNIDLDIDKDLVYRLKTSNENDSIDRLYKYLIIKQCNALNDILPLMFEKIMDYTELLFPDGLLVEGSFLRVMTDKDNISEENWEDVEIIGWLYQYYISERKDEVFAGLKNNKKIQRNDIAPATQLFTPDWIVRYMVENSLGKLWQEGHPNEELKKEWKYYIEEAEQEKEVQEELYKLKEESKKLKIEYIKIIDPAMGSGHILVYAFDLLYDIYISQGYIAHEIPKLIIEKNLYGIDIDKRAFQLAYFALMMKGRSKSRRFFNEKVEINIIPIEESNILLGRGDLRSPEPNSEHVCRGDLWSPESQSTFKNDIKYLIDVFYDAKEYGSILNIEEVNFHKIEKTLEEIRTSQPQNVFQLQYKEIILEKLPPLIKQAKIMSNKYDVVCANPPYMGQRGMNNKLLYYVKNKYPHSKADLFAVFMEKCNDFTKSGGFYSMITQPSWLFLSTFTKLRKKIIENNCIYSLLHMGRGIFGIDFGSTAFAIRKLPASKFNGNYFRLHERVFQYIDADDIGGLFLKAKEKADFKYDFSQYNKYIDEVSINNMEIDGVYSEENLIYYNNKQENFKFISNFPIAYWASQNMVDLFTEQESIEKHAYLQPGLQTSNNNKFLRLWFEINIEKLDRNSGSNEEAKLKGLKWFPYNKGGDFRRWYGNREHVVNWQNDGKEIKKYVDKKYPYLNGNIDYVVKDRGYYFKESITWSFVSSTKFGARYSPKGSLFDVGGSSLFPNDNIERYILGFLNSNIAFELLHMENPTLNFQVGNIASLPLCITEDISTKIEIDNLVNENIAISELDWNSFETSCDFKYHPLLNTQFIIDIKEAFEKWASFTEDQFNQLKANEERLNSIFIKVYGLQDEVTPEIEDKDITICKVVEEKSEEDKKNPYTIDRKQAIESFISYAVGCMLGRYTLDEEGLAYAGGEVDFSKYKTFPADKHNIIPILSGSYFKDDIASRFEQFVEVIFGEDTLNQNLRYIAESLGTRKDESPKGTIRRYFVNDFYKNHTQIYKKRPIYWLFSSGKEKAFNALIYIHRYDSSTLARIRTDYLHVLQSKIDIERINLKDIIAEEDNAAQRKRYEKQLKDLEKKIAELKKYDEKLHTMADQMIEIDLDDGIKVNYEKFKGLVQKI